MEIVSVSRVARSLDEDVVALFEEVSRVFEDVNTLRDRMHATAVKEIDGPFNLVVDAVHNSAAIEGLARSRRETKAALKKVADGAALGQQKRTSEIECLYGAVQRLGRYVRDSISPSCDTLKTLHRDVSGPQTGPVFSPAGMWRREEIYIRNSDWLTPPHEDVPALMERFCVELAAAEEEEDVHPVLLATWAHHTFTQVHPFRDGNGRVARLLQDHLLWCHRLAPAVISAEQKLDYYAALDRADQRDINPLARMVASASQRSGAELVTEYRRRLRRNTWARSFGAKVEKQHREKVSADYHRWRSAMEDLRDAFEVAADALAAARIPVRVQFRAYPTLSESDWIITGAEGRKGGNWFFTVSFLGRNRPMRLYVFSFGRHFVDPDDPEAHRQATVSLQVAERQGRGSHRTLHYDDYDVHVPRLRSVYVVVGDLCARTTDAGANTWNCIESAEANELVERFYRDVLGAYFELHVG